MSARRDRGGAHGPAHPAPTRTAGAGGAGFARKRASTARFWGRGLLGFSIVATVLIVAVVDVFNETHLFNPAWPPHARFHNAMQASTLVLTSLVSLWALAQGRHALATPAPATFWPGLFMALLAPGTTVYASDGLRDLGVPINLVLAALFLVLTALGYRLAAHGSILGGSRPVSGAPVGRHGP